MVPVKLKIDVLIKTRKNIILLTLFFIHSLGKVITKQGFHWPPNPFHFSTFEAFRKQLKVDTDNDYSNQRLLCAKPEFASSLLDEN